jgi:hypothetical protein
LEIWIRNIGSSPFGNDTIPPGARHLGRGSGLARSGALAPPRRWGKLKGMTVTLYGGPLDGQEIEVPSPLPAYVQVETKRGEIRRTHTYALHDGRYEFLWTERRDED